MTTSKVKTDRYATRPATLPALPVVRTNDPELQRFVDAVKERLEVREGSRGSPFERVVTFRDLVDAGLPNVAYFGGRVVRRPVEAQQPGVVVTSPNGGYATLSVDEFADKIRDTALYKSLMQRLDDPTRFDFLPNRIKQELLNDLAAEAAARGAQVREIQEAIQSDRESFAKALREVTASVGETVAGVREAAFAYATDTQAVAAVSRQLVARLDDVDGGGVTIEELLYGSASNAGLLGQYTLKIQAGGALAGIGLAASDIDGAIESAFLIAADKFAIVSPTYSGGLTASPPLANVPFGVDSSGVYIKGTVRINATGSTLDELAADTGIYISYSTQFFKYDASGSPINTSITLNANLTGGLTGYVDWEAVSGYTGSLPADGTTNTATIALADVTGDAATIKIEKVDGATTYTDVVTLVKLRDGSDALTAILTNEAHTIPTNSDGSGGVYTNAGGTFQVYRGSTLLASPAVSFSYVTSSGFSTAPTTSINATTGVYSISGNMNADVATVTYRATVGTTTLDKVFTLTRSKQGSSGSDAKSLVLLANSQVFRTSKAGAVTPSSITFTAVRQNSSATVNWSSTPTGLVTGTGTSKTLTTATMGANQSASVTVTMTDGSDTFTDTVTVVRVAEGSDAVIAVLSNESHTAPSNPDGSSPNLTGASTTMTVFVGATDDSSAWTYTTAVSGVTITGTNTRNVTVTGMSADVGYVDITASKSGYSNITKRFSIAKSKQGASGARGSLTGQAVLSSIIRWTGRTGGKALWASTSGTESNAVTVDNVARDRVWTMLGNSGSAPDNSHLRIGDTVTITNSASSATVAVTGYWSGTAWLNPGVMIDGNLLVNGTVSTNVLIAGQLVGYEINTNPGTGARLVLNEGGVGANTGNNSLRGYDATNTLRTQIDATIGYLYALNTGSTAAVNGQNTGSGNGGSFTATTGNAVRAVTSSSGSAVYGQSSGSGFGGEFIGNSTKAPLRIALSGASAPTNTTDGSIALVQVSGNYRFCVALGGAWYRLNADFVAI